MDTEELKWIWKERVFKWKQKADTKLEYIATLEKLSNSYYLIFGGIFIKGKLKQSVEFLTINKRRQQNFYFLMLFQTPVHLKGKKWSCGLKGILGSVALQSCEGEETKTSLH